MEYEACFGVSSQPLSNTFSYYDKPCQYDEIGSGGLFFPIGYHCPYRDYCTRLGHSLNVLHEAYGPWIKVTLSEPSSSIIARSEHQFSKNDHARLSLRKHFYEVTDGVRSQCGTFCHTIDPRDRLGEYIGFVDLRMEYEASPVAMALLAPPYKLRQDRGTLIMLGLYGPIFGAHAFPATIYCMQDTAYGGAACAQACIIMALGMLSDRHSQVVGSYTLTYLAGSTIGATEPSLPKGGDCLADHPTYRPLKAVGVGGLYPSQCRDLLGANNVSAELMDLYEQKDYDNRMLLRLIEAYVLARFPVILFVNSRLWLEEAIKSKMVDEMQIETGHAVMVVGIQGEATPEAASLVLHDPGGVPFEVRSAQKCLEACWSYSQTDASPRDDKEALLLFVAEKSIIRHAFNCINHIFFLDEDFEIFKPCFEAGNYRIRFVHIKDVWVTYCAGFAYRDLTNGHGSVQSGYYWCFDIRRPDGRAVIWLYSPYSSENEAHWDVRITMVPKDQPIVELRSDAVSMQ